MRVPTKYRWLLGYHALEINAVHDRNIGKEDCVTQGRKIA